MAIKITIFLLIEKLEDQLRGLQIGDEQEKTRLSQYIEKLKESLKMFEGSEDDQGSLLKIDYPPIEFLQNVYLAEEAVDTFRLRTGLQKKKDFIKSFWSIINLFRLSKLKIRFSLEIRNLMNQLTGTVPVGLGTTSSAVTEDIPKTEEQLKKLILNRNSSLFLMWDFALVPSNTSPLRKIYGSADVKKQFQCRAWIDVSKFKGETELPTKIMESFTGAEEEWWLPQTSIRLKLHNFLIWKRYLVVLYNLKTPDIWKNLLRFVLPNSLNGSRVILTFSEADKNKLETTIPNARSCGNLSAMQQESTVQCQDFSDGIDITGPEVSDEEDIVGFCSELTDLRTLLPTGDKHSQDFTDGTEITGPEVSDKDEIVGFCSEVSNLRILVSTSDNQSQDFTDGTEITVPDVSDEEDVVGFYSELSDLRTLVLTGEKPLILVLGVAGSGKTTLVKNVYNHSEMKKKFHVRAWVSVSKFFKEKNVLVKILEQVTQIGDEEKLPLATLRKKLANLLNTQTYLIVFDDVHTSDIWEKLRVVFPTASNGSRVILIFHDPNIASPIGPSIHLLPQRPLTDEESWSLFLKKVSRDARRKAFSQEELQKKILRKCGGLPLSICVLAGLLSTRKYSAASWIRVIEDPERKQKEEKSTVVNDDIQPTKEEAAGTSEHTQQEADSGGQNPSNILLDLAYHDLHFCLRSCLLYFCLFPRSYEIPIRRLFLLWIAEGLMKPLGGVNTEPEDLAESCFEELERRNMIQVERRRSNEKPKTCRLPGLLHDLLYPIAERLMGYFLIHTNSVSTSKSPDFNILMLVEYEDVQNNSFSEFQHLRSYISLNSGKRDKPSDAAGKFLEKITTRRFGFLTLLDLEGVYRPPLPEALGKKLPLLRYVGLRRTFLNSIPESVGDIPCLETLDVKHTLITTLPISIWRAKNLRHLYMHRIYMELVSFTKTDEFPIKLQTLCGLLIDDTNHSINWLTSLECLRKLGLTCHNNSVTKIMSWISQMTSLRSLRLKSVDDDNKPSDLHFPFKFQHEMLTNLYLVGKSDLLHMEYVFPNLRVLTLSESQLSEDPMQILQWLEHLKVLRLFANSYTGKEMTCGRRGFPELQVLKLWMLTELSKWTIEEGAMPALRELEIRCCKKLEKPIELEKVTTLEKLTLTSMKKNFVDDVKGKFGKKVEFIVNDRNFQPLFD